jgi:hypothetical protein
MKYYNILKLLEAKQVGILYHYTSISNGIEICEENRLKAGPDYDGISFTRNKDFHKIQREEISTGVIFVVDGDKLSENYKIQPFNYFWNREQGSKFYTHHDYMDEQEELVRHYAIENFSKYVIKVYIDLHHADCYFEDIDDESEYPHEDIAGHDDLLKYFNRFFPTEWAK